MYWTREGNNARFVASTAFLHLAANSQQNPVYDRSEYLGIEQTAN